MAIKVAASKSMVPTKDEFAHDEAKLEVYFLACNENYKQYTGERSEKERLKLCVLSTRFPETHATRGLVVHELRATPPCMLQHPRVPLLMFCSCVSLPPLTLDTRSLPPRYALFKQATSGDNETEMPYDPLKRRRWEMWKLFKGTTKMTAMRR